MGRVLPWRTALHEEAAVENFDFSTEKAETLLLCHRYSCSCWSSRLSFSARRLRKLLRVNFYKVESLFGENLLGRIPSHFTYKISESVLPKTEETRVGTTSCESSILRARWGATNWQDCLKKRTNSTGIACHCNFLSLLWWLKARLLRGGANCSRIEGADDVRHH
jgi:hypothetical protein